MGGAGSVVRAQCIGGRAGRAARVLAPVWGSARVGSSGGVRVSEGKAEEPRQTDCSTRSKAAIPASAHPSPSSHSLSLVDAVVHRVFGQTSAERGVPVAPGEVGRRVPVCPSQARSPAPLPPLPHACCSPPPLRAEALPPESAWLAPTRPALGLQPPCALLALVGGKGGTVPRGRWQQRPRECQGHLVSPGSRAGCPGLVT